MNVMIGIDPHKASHTAVAIGRDEDQIATIKVRSTLRQVDQLLLWAEPFEKRTWAIESVGGLGYLLAQQLVARGEDVLDVPATLASRIRVLADAIGDAWRSLVLVGCYGGLRIGELLGLRVPRVDLLRAQVDVAEIVTDVAGHLYTGPPKTRAGRRTVQLPRFVVDELAEQLGSRSDGLVWPNKNGDHLRVTSWRRRAWAPAVAAAGLAPLRYHDMRHTAVALWIAAGASPTEIARRAGHRSVVTVLDRYGHLLPGVESRVTDALDEMGRRAAARPAASITQLTR